MVMEKFRHNQPTLRQMFETTNNFTEEVRIMEDFLSNTIASFKMEDLSRLIELEIVV
jgi:hypothetical protein